MLLIVTTYHNAVQHERLITQNGSSATTGTGRRLGADQATTFIVVAAADSSEALGSARKQLYWSTTLLVLMCLTLTLFAFSARRRVGRQAALIAKLHESETRLIRSVDYVRTIIDAMGSPVWVVDDRGGITLFNAAFTTFFGLEANAFAGRNISDIPSLAETRQADANVSHSQLTPHERQFRDAHGITRTVIHHTFAVNCPDGRQQLVNVLADITAQKASETRLHDIANLDTTTSLPNRFRFLQTLQARVMASAPMQARLAVVVISFERLQEIMEYLGHDAGDEAIRAMSNRLASLPDGSGSAARVKTNGLALLLDIKRDAGHIRTQIEALVAQLSAPLIIAAEEYYLAPVAGISLFPQDGVHAERLLRHAEVSSHRAGKDARDAVCFHSELSNRELGRQLNIERHLRRALERNELHMVFQPKVHIGSGKIVSFEALLRWTSASLGAVPPAQFIPVAESTGLILQIGAWALQEACRQAAAWASQFDRPVQVAVNLSMRQFHQRDLIGMIRKNMLSNGAHAVALELEITESVVMSRPDEVEDLLHQIRQLGVTLSIDDFGTGYSSLAYLKRFPVQYLKIDRAFVRDLGADLNSAAIIESIVSLAHGLNLRVVAEGVETTDQLRFLQTVGCDEYQGYLFSKPLRADDATALLLENWAEAASHRNV